MEQASRTQWVEFSGGHRRRCLFQATVKVGWCNTGPCGPLGVKAWACGGSAAFCSITPPGASADGSFPVALLLHAPVPCWAASGCAGPAEAWAQASGGCWLSGEPEEECTTRQALPCWPCALVGCRWAFLDDGPSCARSDGMVLLCQCVLCPLHWHGPTWKGSWGKCVRHCVWRRRECEKGGDI